MPATCPGLANLDRKWYNTYDTSGGDTSSWYGYGAEFKLDVGLYRLDQQVACQRIDTILDATSKIRDAVASVKGAFQTAALAFAPRATAVA